MTRYRVKSTRKLRHTHAPEGTLLWCVYAENYGKTATKPHIIAKTLDDALRILRKRLERSHDRQR